MQIPRAVIACGSDRDQIFEVLGLALILSLVASYPSYSQTSQADDHARSAISGTVVNSVTHEPVGHALVFSPGSLAAAFTDDHGHFEIDFSNSPENSPVAPGMGLYRVEALWAEKPGYLPGQGDRAMVSGGTGTRDVTFSLVPEGLIAGRVKFSNSDPTGQVPVQLYSRQVQEGIGRWMPLKQATMRTDGEFRFADLPAGDYKLFTQETLDNDPLVAVPGGPLYAFQPTYLQGAHDFATATTIRVEAGKMVTANIVPERQRYYPIKIPIVGLERGKLPGFSVLVYARGHRGPGFQLGLEGGSLSIVGSLPNGNFTIEVSVPRPVAATGVAEINVANGPVNGPPVVMAENPSIPVNIKQEFTATDAARATGVTEDRREPAAYVQLPSTDEFEMSNGSWMGSQSDGDPPELRGVRPGIYWVVVNPRRGYVASVTSGGKNLLREPLVVPPGASVPPIEITLRDDGASLIATEEGTANAGISGTTQGSAASYAGAPARLSLQGRNWTVYCVSLANAIGDTRVLFMRRDGEYSLEQIPPGDYRILALENNQPLEYRNPEAMRRYESKGQVIHLAPGEKAHIKLQPIEGN